jgi:hypothetical protein
MHDATRRDDGEGQPMTDDELLSGFENCTLPNEAFHHEEHVRVAFLYLTRHSTLEALERFSKSLRKFAEAHGKSTLYNETVTWAYMLMIRERMARSGVRSWSEFRAANLDLLDRQREILKKYYTAETLQSALAKTTFLFPDRL